MIENRWANSEEEAIQALTDYFAALNAGDNRALFNTMHVPHVRISGDGVAIYHTLSDLETTYLLEFSERAGDAWHHSILDSTEMIHSSEHKVHLFIQFTRCDQDNNPIATHRSLWIMTEIEGRWGAQARSSFAP